MLTSLWQKYVAPIIRRPAAFQVAALCHRQGEAGTEIILITSLDTGRWILPKGWPITGLDAESTALREAWEEAGVSEVGENRPQIGTYHYLKRVEGGVPVPTDVKVFAVPALALAADYPEAKARRREWVSPEEAATRVDEPDLAELLRGFDPATGETAS